MDAVLPESAWPVNDGNSTPKPVRLVDNFWPGDSGRILSYFCIRLRL